jgi:hypothetical protein
LKRFGNVVHEQMMVEDDWKGQGRWGCVNSRAARPATKIGTISRRDPRSGPPSADLPKVLASLVIFVSKTPGSPRQTSERKNPCHRHHLFDLLSSCVISLFGHGAISQLLLA